MSLKIGNKTPVAMMVGNRHVKKASMFVHKSSTTYNIDQSKMSYSVYNELLMEPLPNNAATFSRSGYNKTNRTLTFSSIICSFVLMTSYPPPIGMLGASVTVGLTGKVNLNVTSTSHPAPDVTAVVCRADNVTIQFSYSEWNQIYTETTNYWWEEKVVYERVKNVYPHLIPYTTNPSGKDFTITYGSITESLRRLNNVTMIHESDYYGGISVNIAGGIYPTTRTILSDETVTNYDNIPYTVISGIDGQVSILASGVDDSTRTIQQISFSFSTRFAFEGAHIEIHSGNKSGGEFYTDMGGAFWYTRVYLYNVTYTQAEWNQFVQVIREYRYRMTASSLTFSQTDWDKFYV